MPDSNFWHMCLCNFVAGILLPILSESSDTLYWSAMRFSVFFSFLWGKLEFLN